MNNLEELLDKLPSTYNWNPLIITKNSYAWVIEYGKTISVESESLKDAVEEVLRRMKS